ncbi:hypothetical protein J1614_011503 [Plenodomus biglobosus]|nr:hypothetical protein J1614_011503 [Plenodomus biglobosus]
MVAATLRHATITAAWAGPDAIEGNGDRNGEVDQVEATARSRATDGAGLRLPGGCAWRLSWPRRSKRGRG